MNKLMTPSVEITDRQIDKAGDTLRASFIGTLRKHRGEFSNEAVQKALGAKGLTADLLAVFRRYVERFSNLIVRMVRPNRTQSPQAALDATGRTQYTTASVVASMPRGTGDEVKVIFFKPDQSAYDANGWINDDNLEKQYAYHGLKPADPFSLAKVNEDDSAFADKHPNATHWKDSDGKWCYAAFFRWHDGGRYVNVRRHDQVWRGNWLFAGLAISPDLVPKTKPTPALDLEIDHIVRVDRSIRPSYPDWVAMVMHRELENIGPTKYDIIKTEQWLHDGQKDGKWIEGNKIYAHLKDTDDLRNHFRLRDLEEIQKKGNAFFRKHFAGKVVFAWQGVVCSRSVHLRVPCLYEGDGKVILSWSWLSFDWFGSNPGLRHAS